MAFSGKAEGDYSYRARACNDNSECSANSAVVTVTVNIFTDPEPPVLTVPAASDDGSFTVSWTSSDGAAQYRLEEQNGSDGWNGIHQGGATRRILTGKDRRHFHYKAQPLTGQKPQK